MLVAVLDTVHPLLQAGLEADGMRCAPLLSETPQELLETCAGWNGIVIRSRVPMDKAFLSRCSALQWIARSGAGLENIDLAYCKVRGIAVFSAAEGNRDAVGEHALGMLLALWNKLPSGDRSVREGKWLREAHRGREIAGTTVGILGFGRMGSAFADKLRGLRCRVIAHDAFNPGFRHPGVEEVDLETLQKHSDVLSVHIDQRPGNDHYINHRFLMGFAKPVTVINTGRGKTLDTAALSQALELGKVCGACLDVLEYEKRSFTLDAELPDAFKALITREDVLLSPHVAGWTVESYAKLSQVLLDKIRAHHKA